MKDKIIVIVGPTAVGKTAYSIELAKELNGEVISGDSMQIYKELDIGTAKATPEEMDDIPHYLINIKEMDEAYSVSDFQEEASIKIKEIIEKGKVPIIAGGTGLYVESLLYPVSHGNDSEPNYELRDELEQFAKENGNNALWLKLEEIDPEAASKIHENNVRRVVRALEVYYETGRLFSSLQNEKKKKAPVYDAYIIGLNTERELLYERINMRVDLMKDAGLIEEAKMLWERLGPEPEAQSTRGIGYQEFFPYFNKEIALDEAVESIKQNSRRYAKRQLTWFRNRLENVHWYDFVLEEDSKEESIVLIKNFLEDD